MFSNEGVFMLRFFRVAVRAAPVAAVATSKASDDVRRRVFGESNAKTSATQPLNPFEKPEDHSTKGPR